MLKYLFLYYSTLYNGSLDLRQSESSNFLLQSVEVTGSRAGVLIFGRQKQSCGFSSLSHTISSVRGNEDDLYGSGELPVLFYEQLQSLSVCQHDVGVDAEIVITLRISTTQVPAQKHKRAIRFNSLHFSRSSSDMLPNKHASCLDNGRTFARLSFMDDLKACKAATGHLCYGSWS